MPDGSATEPTNNRAIHGSAADDVWVVGLGQPAHFDGSSWKNYPAVPAAFTDVWVDSPTQAYAAAGNEILSWNGAEWSQLVTLPFEYIHLQSLGDGRLWIVGWEKSGGRHVMRYQDGEQTDYLPQLTGSANPPALWVNSDCDVWLGGRGLAHFDGETWTRVALPDLPLGVRINAIYGRSPDDVWVAANFQLFHFDGQQWTKPEMAPEADQIWGCEDRVFLGGVVYDGSGDAWKRIPSSPFAVGISTWSAGSGSFLQITDQSAEILRYNAPLGD